MERNEIMVKIIFTKEVQWLRLCSSNAWTVDLIPGWGIKMPHAMEHDKKKKKTHTENNNSNNKNL